MDTWENLGSPSSKGCVGKRTLCLIPNKPIQEYILGTSGRFTSTEETPYTAVMKVQQLLTMPHNFAVLKTLKTMKTFMIAAINAFLSLEKLKLPCMNRKLEWIFIIFDRRYNFPTLEWI